MKMYWKTDENFQIGDHNHNNHVGGDDAPDAAESGSSPDSFISSPNREVQVPISWSNDKFDEYLSKFAANNAAELKFNDLLSPPDKRGINQPSCQPGSKGSGGGMGENGCCNQLISDFLRLDFFDGQGQSATRNSEFSPPHNGNGPDNYTSFQTKDFYHQTANPRPFNRPADSQLKDWTRSSVNRQQIPPSSDTFFRPIGDDEAGASQARPTLKQTQWSNTFNKMDDLKVKHKYFENPFFRPKWFRFRGQFRNYVQSSASKMGALRRAMSSHRISTTISSLSATLSRKTAFAISSNSRVVARSTAEAIRMEIAVMKTSSNFITRISKSSNPSMSTFTTCSALSSYRHICTIKPRDLVP